MGGDGVLTSDDWCRFAAACCEAANQCTRKKVSLLEADEVTRITEQARFANMTDEDVQQEVSRLKVLALKALQHVDMTTATELVGAFRSIKREFGDDPRWAEAENRIRETPRLESSDPLARTPGMVISDLTEEGPAWTAGLRAKDLIVSANGSPVRDFGDFTDELRRLKPGTEFEIVVYRYARSEGKLVGTDESGNPILNEHGLPDWKHEEIRLTLKAGYLGVSVSDGLVPSPFDP